MEHHNTGNPAEGLIYVVSAVFCYIFSLITADQVRQWIGFGFTITSGFMAIRYYYYATKKAKK